MRKKYVQLGIVAALFLCVLGALLLLGKAPAEEKAESPAAEKTYVIGGEAALNVAQIDITNEAGGYSISNRTPAGEKSDLIIKGWDDLSLDSYALGQAETSAKAMEAKRLVAENAEAALLPDYGLDKPRAGAVIRYADNSSAEISIGADAPGGEGVYVKRGGDNDVYLVSQSLAEPFLKPDVAYVNKNITETDPEYKGFDKIVLSGADYPEPIVIVRTPETTLEAGGMTFNTHSITSPVQAFVDSQKGLEPLSSVYGLAAEEVLAVSDGKPETLEKYGLAEPAAVISVTGSGDNPGMSFELRISKPVQDGGVNAIKSGSPVIYRLPESAFPWLGLTVFDYMEKAVTMPNISTIASVKLTTSRGSYEFTLTGEDDELAVSLNGKELPDVVKADGATDSAIKNFKQFYQTMISARYEALTDEAPPEGAVPLAQIEYRYKSGKAADTVKFYSGPTRRAFVTLNDGKIYLCQLAYVDRLIEDAVKMAAGEAVKSYY